MADIVLDNQGTPATPAAGTTDIYVDSTNKELSVLNDTGVVRTVRPLTNANTADVTASAADTYLTGSSINVPVSLLKVGTRIKWHLGMTKTAAGTATPIFNVRVGTAGTVADTARLTWTLVAQTALTDTGWCEISVIVRSIGASGVIHGEIMFTHAGNPVGTYTQGLATFVTQVQQSTSSAFDMTVASLIVGISCNPGASGVWTFQHVRAEAMGI